MDKEKIILVTFDTKLVEDVSDYRSLCQTPACEALMAAYKKYENEPQKEVWVGESVECPEIVAVLERNELETGLVATVYDENLFLNCIV